MKKKILALLSGLMLTAAMLAGTVAPAQAAPQYATRWLCSNYYNVTTCALLEWSRQADGSGVRLEGYQVMTSNGCSSLESGRRYDPVRGTAFASTGSVDYGYNFGVEPCNFHKDLSNAVGTKGCARFTFSLHARVPGRGDKTVYHGWTLCPAGDYVVDLNEVGGA